MSMVDTKALDERIAAKIDTKTTALTVIRPRRKSAIRFTDMGQVMEFAKIMAVSDIGVRKHLRRNVGACLAVCTQALDWEMSPYSVANKSYLVNDQIAYEAQLINAVILTRAPIKGRFKISYAGQGENRVCTVAVAMEDGGPDALYESPAFGLIKPKNSPLWTTDPDQQLFYYSSRALCRRHFPDVLLGVYAVDEVLDGGGDFDEPTPTASPPRPRIKDLGERLDRVATGQTIEHDPETGEIIEDQESASVAPASDAAASPSDIQTGDREGAGPAGAPSDTGSALNERDAAILADLLETGAARAEGGQGALNAFLYGLEPHETNLIPKAVSDAWTKTARAVTAKASKRP